MRSAVQLDLILRQKELETQELRSGCQVSVFSARLPDVCYAFWLSNDLPNGLCPPANTRQICIIQW